MPPKAKQIKALVAQLAPTDAGGARAKAMIGKVPMRQVAPPPKHDDDHGAGVILAAAARTAGPGGKAFISDVAKALGTSVASLTPTLIKLNKTDAIELQRCDMPAAFSPDTVRASTISDGIGTYHFVRAGSGHAPSAPAKAPPPKGRVGSPAAARPIATPRVFGKIGGGR